jgi:hypothetical protein
MTQYRQTRSSLGLGKLGFQAIVVTLLVANYWNLHHNCILSEYWTVSDNEKGNKNDPVDQARSVLTLPVMGYGNSSWCPGATCHNSVLCQPCKRRFLVIFSIGRSASTTLTWMLDSLPGIRMSGENNDMLRQQFFFYSNTFEENHFGKSVGEKNSFGRNPVPAGSLSCILQNTVELITPPLLPVVDVREEQSTIVGFKTIRSHMAKNEKEMELFVSFLKENLPCTRYLINYRSDMATLKKSLKSNFLLVGDIEKIIEWEKQQLELLYKLLGPDHAFKLDSSKWTKNVSVLNEALDWLGFSSSCYFSELLEFNTAQYMHTKTEFVESSTLAHCARL